MSNVVTNEVLERRRQLRTTPQARARKWLWDGLLFSDLEYGDFFQIPPEYGGDETVYTKLGDEEAAVWSNKNGEIIFVRECENEELPFVPSQQIIKRKFEEIVAHEVRFRAEELRKRVVVLGDYRSAKRIVLERQQKTEWSGARFGALNRGEYFTFPRAFSGGEKIYVKGEGNHAYLSCIRSETGAWERAVGNRTSVEFPSDKPVLRTSKPYVSVPVGRTSD